MKSNFKTIISDLISKTIVMPLPKLWSPLRRVKPIINWYHNQLKSNYDLNNKWYYTATVAPAGTWKADSLQFSLVCQLRTLILSELKRQKRDGCHRDQEQPRLNHWWTHIKQRLQQTVPITLPSYGHNKPYLSTYTLDQKDAFKVTSCHSFCYHF